MTAGTSALCVKELSKLLLESVHNFSEVSSSDCVLSSSGSSLCSVVRLASVSVGPTTALGICVWLKTGYPSTSLREVLLLPSFPRAARGYLLSPLSFARLHTLFVWSLVLFPQSFCSLHLLRVDGTLLFWSLCACSPMRGTGAATMHAPLTW